MDNSKVLQNASRLVRSLLKDLGTSLGNFTLLPLSFVFRVCVGSIMVTVSSGDLLGLSHDGGALQGIAGKDSLDKISCSTWTNALLRTFRKYV